MKTKMLRILALMLGAIILMSSVVPVMAAKKSYTYSVSQIEKLDKEFKSQKSGYYLYKFGSSNKASLVKAVQVMLTELNYANLDYDSTYGPKTAAAVKTFQKKNGLTQDSCAGPATWKKLVSEYKAAVNSSKKTTSTTIAYSSLSFAGTIQQGNGEHIKGKITSTNSKLASVTATVTNSSNKVVMEKTDSSINAYTYNLYNSDLDWAMTFGTLKAGKYTLVYTAKTKNNTTQTSEKITFTVKAASNPSPSSSKASTNKVVKADSYTYNVKKAIDFADENAYKNSSWRCAEFVDRCLRAGGVNISIQKRCQELIKEVEKLDNVTKYKLTMESNGSILPEKNKGKIETGDVIAIYCEYCKKYVDKRPWTHVVMAGTISNGKPIQVYAHNKSYKNEAYYGFKSCDTCKSTNCEAYSFHFVHK